NFSQPGTKSVSYTVTDGPCLNTAATSFFVHKFNSSNLNRKLIERCVSANPVNLMSYVQSTVNGTWGGINVNSSLFNPVGLQTNTYEVYYHTTPTPAAPPELCDDTDTLQIAILNPELPDLGQVGPLCSADAPVKIAVSTDKGYWVETSYLNSEGLFTPVLASIGNNAVQYVVGTPTCNAKETIFVNVEA